MGVLGTYFSAKISNLMPNIRDPAIATKRFARNDLDKAFGLTNPANFGALFDSYTAKAMASGNPDEFVKSTKRFIQSVRGTLISIENAEGGTLNLMRNRIHAINDMIREVEQKLAVLKKKVTNEEYQKTINEVHKDWMELQHLVVDDVLANVIKLQKDIEFGRSQMITQVFRLEISMKKDLAFFFFRSKDDRKEDRSLFKSLERDIERIKPTEAYNVVSKDAVKIAKELQKEMGEIKEEMRLLTVLMIHIEETAVGLENVVLQKLQKTGLDPAMIEDIKKTFGDLHAYIKQQSAVNVERAKQMIPEVKFAH